MEVNAHGEVTRKYRKAAMLDRELARGTEEERALQEAFEAKEARQRAAARGAGQRRRLGSAGLRKVTLMFDGRARGMPTSSLGAVFELTLPASWDAKPCRKLLKHFVRSYAIKYPDEPPLREACLELLREDGGPVAPDAVIGETLGGGDGVAEELAVAFTASGDRVANAPVVIMLGDTAGSREKKN